MPQPTSSKPSLDSLITVSRPSRTAPYLAEVFSSTGRELLFATGATRAEAQQALLDAMRAALAADYRPRVITWRGLAYLLWREPTDWSVRSAQLDLATGEISQAGTSSYPSWDEAERSIRLHVAQCGWDRDADTYPAFVPEIVVDDASRQQFLSYTRWQRRYHVLASQGLTRAEIDQRMFHDGY